MSTTIGPNYDPASTAAALATQYTSGQQELLASRTKQAATLAAALGSLKSAISAYQSSLFTLTASKSMLAQAATFSNTAVGSASAKPGATAGTYSFFVEKLATAHQVSYAGMPASAVPSGSLGVSVGGTAFTVDLAAADLDADSSLTPRELAAAINTNAANSGLVSASIVTIDGVAQLVLTSKLTGAANQVALDATKVGDAGLKTVLAAVPAQMVAAQNAVVWLGAENSGSRIEQASNTLTNVADVTMTFTKAQASGEAAVVLTVATDSSATAANAQGFVDAYNKLKGVLDGLTASGDPAKGVGAGVFAHDSGINVLLGRLVSMARQNIGGATLAGYGMIAARDGTLTLNATQLNKGLALNPGGLDQLIGNTSLNAPSGLAGNLDTYLKGWSSTVNGQIKLRQEATAKLQAALASRQDELDRQYDSAYQRYLGQFTRLQSIQSRMASNTSMFDALFGKSDD